MTNISAMVNGDMEREKRNAGLGRGYLAIIVASEEYVRHRATRSPETMEGGILRVETKAENIELVKTMGGNIKTVMILVAPGAVDIVAEKMAVHADGSIIRVVKCALPWEWVSNVLIMKINGQILPMSNWPTAVFVVSGVYSRI